MFCDEVGSLLFTLGLMKIVDTIRRRFLLNQMTMKPGNSKKSKATLSRPTASSVAPPTPSQAPTLALGAVAFELIKPEAKTVFLAGSFNGWKPDQTPLERTRDGKWMREVRPKPGRHEYLFVVDGSWQPDPLANESVENPFGGKNSVVTISA